MNVIYSEHVHVSLVCLFANNLMESPFIFFPKQKGDRSTRSIHTSEILQVFIYSTSTCMGSQEVHLPLPEVLSLTHPGQR